MITQPAITQSFLPSPQRTVINEGEWWVDIGTHSHPTPFWAEAAKPQPRWKKSLQLCLCSGPPARGDLGAVGKAEETGAVLVSLPLPSAGSRAWKHLIFWNPNSLVQ